MKTAISFFSILILFAGLVFAETEIFSGIAVTDTDKDIAGTIFRFGYDETSNKVLVQTPATSLIIDNGACKSSSVFKVCINQANFSHKNISTYKYYYEIGVTVYKLTGSLSTNTTLSQGTLLLGESAEFEITITNPTDFQISGINYTGDFAPFAVAKATGCELDGNKILWQGSLQSKYSKKCTATIVAEEDGAYNLVGNLKYFNSLEAEEKTTAPASVKVLPRQLQLIKLMDNNTQVNKPFHMNISLQNIHNEEDIRLSIEIGIPPSIDVLKTKPEFDITARTLRKETMTLRPGAFFNYSLYLEETSEGYDPITQEFRYVIKGINDVMKNATFLRQPQVEPTAEPKIEKAIPENISSANSNQTNESATNTSTNEVSTQTAPEPKTGNTSLESRQENKTAGQGAVIEKSTLSFLNKKLLLLIGSSALISLALFFIINKIRKRKKAAVSPQEQLLRELEESLRKG